MRASPIVRSFQDRDPRPRVAAATLPCPSPALNAPCFASCRLSAHQSASSSACLCGMPLCSSGLKLVREARKGEYATIAQSIIRMLPDEQDFRRVKRMARRCQAYYRSKYVRAAYKEVRGQALYIQHWFLRVKAVANAEQLLSTATEVSLLNGHGATVYDRTCARAPRTACPHPAPLLSSIWGAPLVQAAHTRTSRAHARAHGSAAFIISLDFAQGNGHGSELGFQHAPSLLLSRVAIGSLPFQVPRKSGLKSDRRSKNSGVASSGGLIKWVELSPTEANGREITSTVRIAHVPTFHSKILPERPS